MSVIPPNIFGPHDNFDPETAHVLPALIHKCWLAKQSGPASPLVVRGSGWPLRQFVYAPDLGALTLWVMRHYDGPGPLILCADEDDEMRIAELAHAIARAMDFQGTITFDRSHADGQVRKTVTNIRLRRLLPDFRFTPFEQALQETCNWFVKHREDARGVASSSVVIPINLNQTKTHITIVCV